jgi:hypothetical protein
MLGEHDVLVGASGRHGVPDAVERGFVVVGLDGDLEVAGVIGIADIGIGQCLAQRGLRSFGALAAMQHVHADDLSSAHVTGRCPAALADKPSSEPGPRADNVGPVAGRRP